MVNNPPLNLFQSDKNLTLQTNKLINFYLDEEERKLRLLAERALLESELRDSAVLQLGRVSILREVSVYLKRILQEQNNGNQQ